MFTSFNKLNEGGCADTPKASRKNELHEGPNPKVAERGNQLHRWANGKILSHKNSPPGTTSITKIIGPARRHKMLNNRYSSGLSNPDYSQIIYFEEL